MVFAIHNIMSNRSIIVDDAFIQRVYKTSLLLSLFIIIFSLSYRDSAITLGLLMGVSISLIFFKLLCWTVNKFFSSKLHMKKMVFFAVKITLLKLPLLGVILYYALRYIKINPLALIVGIGIVQAVMVLKVAGMLLVNYMNSPART